ncbi:MAG TPA: hypothetical protein VFN45_16775 [Myxococcaceae bacterium]|nr:hypothetical protein [Myxococcaceae bacterium]
MSRRVGPAGAVALALVLARCASTSAPAPPPPADPRLLAALRASVPQNPIGVGQDPYSTWAGRTPPRPPPDTVCGVRFEADRIHYRLATFASPAEAAGAGYRVTHTGGCGACSTLQDLAVYLERPDLTTPVRRCGMQPGTLGCIEALGFSHSCAQIWDFNVQNTRRECFGVCTRSWMSGEPSTRADGTLNDCLQCDEDRSGPVFKAVAGRTRRNSGIRSSIPRPDEQVAQVVHDYVQGPAPAPAPPF